MQTSAKLSLMCACSLDVIANSITAATYNVIAQGEAKTPDLGGISK